MSLSGTMTVDGESRQLLQVDPAAGRETTAIAGMTVFLGSWAMMFAALFFSYFILRTGVPLWPPLPYEPLPLGLPALNTLLLLASSATLVWGIRSAEAGRSLLPGLGATVLLGTVFLALQWSVWASLWASGLELTSGHYGAIFYLLTVFHALHVLVGLGFLVAMLPRAFRGVVPSHRMAPVRVTALFWHFVDVVWVLLFLVVYVV